MRHLIILVALGFIVNAGLWSAESSGGGNGHFGPPPGGPDCPPPPPSDDSDGPPPPPPPPARSGTTTSTNSGGTTTSTTNAAHTRINWDQVLQQIYTAADTDGTGLTPTEFATAAKAFHDYLVANRPQNAPPPPADQHTAAQKAAALNQAFTQADANGDGVLSFDEFKVAIHLLAPPHQHHGG